MEIQLLKNILEAALMVAGQPLNLGQLGALFAPEEQPEKELLRAAVDELIADCTTRGIELVEVASGYRYQIKQDIYPHLGRMWEEKPQRYSRALLETMALIAYRQPITRGEIEEVRGVSVSTNIIRTLEERDWIRVVGHRDVPGKPALYGTTRNFLDYFNLRSLDALPTLAELRDIDEIEPELAFNTEPTNANERASPEAVTDVAQVTAEHKAASHTEGTPEQEGSDLFATPDTASTTSNSAAPAQDDDADLAGDLDAILAEVDQVLDSTAKTKQVTIALPSAENSATDSAQNLEHHAAAEAAAAHEALNTPDDSASDAPDNDAQDDTTGTRDHA